MSDLHRLLSADSGGGLIESLEHLDRDELAAAAAQHGARFGELHGPTSKAALLESLREVLSLPRYTGSNWDALEEVLAYPERQASGPALVAWHDPRRLPTLDAGTFKAIIQSAAEARARSGDGPLVVVAGPLAV
jgi:hypothetical protein